MSDLDDKLEQLLRALVLDEWHDDGYLPGYRKAIKKAFTDAGYVAVVKGHTIYRKDSSEELRDTLVMTCQEWYDKFIERMGEAADNCMGCSCVAVEAAKSAARLDELKH